MKPLIDAFGSVPILPDKRTVGLYIEWMSINCFNKDISFKGGLLGESFFDCYFSVVSYEYILKTIDIVYKIQVSIREGCYCPKYLKYLRNKISGF